jgi:hypothetical protein
MYDYWRRGKQVDRHWTSQTEYLTDTNGNLVEADFLGRFEALQEDWDAMMRWAKWKFELGDHRHKSKRLDQYYTQETLEMAEERFADDIENFNYGKGNEHYQTN